VRGPDLGTSVPGLYTARMKVALAQVNPVVGDIAGNVGRIADGVQRAHTAGATLVAFPELCLSGYPPRDLLERPAFIAQCDEGLQQVLTLSRQFPGLGILVGLPLASTSPVGKRVSNSAVLVCDGAILHRHDKLLLPTYDVFDEARYFEPAQHATPVDFQGERLGISICEDAWNDPALFRRPAYHADPIAMLAQAGATLHINISASPYSVGKDALRSELVRSHARRHRTPFIMVNQVGGNDELVFDGRSLCVDAEGRVRAELPAFRETLQVIDTRAPGADSTAESLDDVENIRRALVLGMRDYFARCGFTRAVVGLSGGVDSAVTLCLGVDAIGAANLLAVSMPSPFTSQTSIDDARTLASNLGVRLDVIPIHDAMAAYDRALEGVFAGQARDVTEENLQARIRGNLLMALSNKFGHLVLSTGNKSELAVGYCTLYGDMSGGLALISDVPKTDVYRLAERYNHRRDVIPRSVLERAPSAELRPDQKDSDSLPPYDVLDPILDLYVEQGLTSAEIVARGYARETVDWVTNAVRKSEYKRRQAAPGIKVTSKAFGAGRRFPIAARYTV